MKFLLPILMISSLNAFAETGILAIDPNPVTRIYFGRVDRVHESVQTESSGSTRTKAEEQSEVLRDQALAQKKKSDIEAAEFGKPGLFVNVLAHESEVVPSYRHVSEAAKVGWSVVESFSIKSSYLVATSRPTAQAKSELAFMMMKVIKGEDELLFEENYNLGLFRLSHDGYRLKIQAGDYVRNTIATFIGNVDRKNLKSQIVFVGKDGEYDKMNLNEKETAELLNLPPVKPSFGTRVKALCAKLVGGKL